MKIDWNIKDWKELSIIEKIDILDLTKLDEVIETHQTIHNIAKRRDIVDLDITTDALALLGKIDPEKLDGDQQDKYNNLSDKYYPV